MMTKIKRFFITLLSFCSMGSIVLAQETGSTEDGFDYTITSAGTIYINKYTGKITSTLKFPKINNKLVRIPNSFTNTTCEESVSTLDFTNVESIIGDPFSIETEFIEDFEAETFTEVITGHKSLSHLIIGKDTEYSNRSTIFTSNNIRTISFSDDVEKVTSNMIPTKIKGTITTINLNNTTSIDNNVFSNCGSLKSINLSKITEIGNNAFEHSGLIGTIELSKDIISIGEKAFYNTDLSTIIFYSNPEISTNAIPANCASHLYIVNDIDLYVNENINTFSKVFYQRSISKSTSSSRKFAGLILPFKPGEKEGAKYAFYQLNNTETTNSESITFDIVNTNDVTPNTPYLFEYWGQESIVTIESEGEVTIGNQEESYTKTFGNGWKAIGVYKKQTEMLSNGYLYSISGGEFTKYNNNLTVNPYRVYWEAPSAQFTFTLRTGHNETTSINFAEEKNPKTATYYDLMGRHVPNPIKGNLYLVNGKKVIF